MADTRTNDLPVGHRVDPRVSSCAIEAWAPNRAACCSEALCALVEEFAQVSDPVSTAVVPLVASPGRAEDELVSLLEEVICMLDVFSVVPVCFHLAETEDGRVAGDMEVVPVGHVGVVGPVPKAVSPHELLMASDDGGWRCHVLIEV